jgi:hypothetical protein
MLTRDTRANVSPVCSARARARLAIVACALWLGGVEVMPALHEATHGQLGPHRHDAGSIVTVSFDDTTHRHPDGTIHFASPKSRPARPQHAGKTWRGMHDGRPQARDAAQHADGLAHHAAALAPVPPPVTRPLPVDRRPFAVAIARSIELVASDPLAATARGPPTLA